MPSLHVILNADILSYEKGEATMSGSNNDESAVKETLKDIHESVQKEAADLAANPWNIVLTAEKERDIGRRSAEVFGREFADRIKRGRNKS